MQQNADNQCFDIGNIAVSFRIIRSVPLQYSGRSRCFFGVFGAVPAAVRTVAAAEMPANNRKNAKSPVFEFCSQLLSWIFQQHPGKSEHIEAERVSADCIGL